MLLIIWQLTAHGRGADIGRDESAAKSGATLKCMNSCYFPSSHRVSVTAILRSLVWLGPEEIRIL